MINIIQDFIPKGRKNRPGYSMLPKYITIHDTGNSSKGTDAKQHALYLKNNNISTSWHFTVDDKEIIQHLPLNENGWHCGDGTNGKGNRQSIGIEICMNVDGDRLKAEQNAIKLCRYLIKEIDSLVNFPDCIKQHYDWTRKECPQILRKENRWNDFVSQIEEKEEQNKLTSWEREVGIEALNNLVKLGDINSPDYHLNKIEDNWLLFVLVNKQAEKIIELQNEIKNINKINIDIDKLKLEIKNDIRNDFIESIKKLSI